MMLSMITISVKTLLKPKGGHVIGRMKLEVVERTTGIIEIVRG